MTTTRDRIREIRARDPHASAQEIADEVGVSRQRIYQLLNELGLRTRTVYTRPRSGRTSEPVARTGGVQGKISTLVAGTIGELLVAADLLARGYVAFGPIGPHTACHDLIAVHRKTHEVRTIEVRFGRRLRSGAASCGRKPTDCSDHYAIVITGEPVVYDPPLPDAPHADHDGRSRRAGVHSAGVKSR